MIGGTSGLISMQTVFNILLAEHPDVIQRLYYRFNFDRQSEHATGDKRLAFNPICEPVERGVHIRFSRRLLKFGYELADGDMNDATRAAITSFRKILDRPGPDKRSLSCAARFSSLTTADWPTGAKPTKLAGV